MSVNKPAGTAGPIVTSDDALRLLDEMTVMVAAAAAATLATPVSEIERRIKPDLSPVTAADEASEAAILEGLSRLLPSLPVIAEESAAQAPARPARSFAIVDPLDGTKEFLAGRDEFTVNLAIVTDGVPVAGIIAAPKRGLVWRGVAGNKADRLRMRWDEPARAERAAIHTRPAPERLVVATSRSHLDPRTEEFLARLPVGQRYACGSSVKFCQVAEGAADLYPRLAPTREWDIAAGCAILAAAGGAVTDPQGGPLRFGAIENQFLVPGFIAWGDPAMARRVK